MLRRRLRNVRPSLRIVRVSNRIGTIRICGRKVQLTYVYIHIYYIVARYNMGNKGAISIHLELFDSHIALTGAVRFKSVNQSLRCAHLSFRHRAAAPD
jgi:hypothetical protein